MKRSILVVFMIVMVAAPCFAQEISTLSTELQEALDRAREESGIIGMSASAIKVGDGQFLAVSGFSDKNPAEPIQPEMLFCVGSITKTFTATLILQLAEEGVLDLDDTVGEWLPGLPQKSSRWIDDTVTIRQLLNHTSGVSNFWDNLMWYVIAWVLFPDKILEPEDILTFVQRPYFAPGEGFHYSNTNYILLGMIIEEATNSNIAVELRNRLFDPIGLENTFLEIEEPVYGELAHGHMLGFDQTRFPREARYSSGFTAASILSTAEDIAMWAQALFRGDVLSEDSLEQMLDVIDSDLSFFELEIKVGLGMMLLEHPQFGEVWNHTGQMEGYTAFMGYVPDNDIILVVLMNQHFTDFAFLESLLEAVLN